MTDCPITAIVCYDYDTAQAAVALTGLPTRVGDDMQFTPASFLALSNGAGFVTAGPANFVFSRVWTPGGQEIASLTVNEVADQADGTAHFTLNIIPHTQEMTTLNEAAAGRPVNLEIDILARYLARMQTRG